MIDYKEKAKHFLYDFCASGDAYATEAEELDRMEKELRELVTSAQAEVGAIKPPAMGEVCPLCREFKPIRLRDEIQRALAALPAAPEGEG